MKTEEARKEKGLAFNKCTGRNIFILHATAWSVSSGHIKGQAV